MRAALLVLWLGCGTRGDDGRALIQGFPTSPHAWTLSHRTGLSTRQPASSEMLGVTEENTMEFAPFDGQRNTALFASKYIYPKQPIRGSLRYKIRHVGGDAPKVRIYMDIDYVNHTIFHIEELLKENGNTCFVIPDYGPIRALMVHIVLEQKTESSIQLNDFLLSTQEDLGHGSECTLYEGSSPYHRQVIYNFLVPKYKMQDQSGVTVTTQLTFDRYSLLEEMVAQWQGPVSVAFFALDTNRDGVDEVAEFTRRYHANPLLQTHVTVHLVYPDARNDADGAHFPINYLRNVALSGAGTGDVFSLDIGTLPAFTSKQATLWVSDARDAEDCVKCAFIAPLFDAASLNTTTPQSKKELALALEAGDVKDPTMGYNGSVPVTYWLKKDQLLQATLRETMEACFISGLSAPMVSEMCTGYGRDKCTHSRDVYHTGHRFYVLPSAFLVRKKLPHIMSNTGTSGRISMRMFTNVAFHMSDVEHGYFRYRHTNMTSKLDSEECNAETCTNEISYPGVYKYTVSPKIGGNDDQTSGKLNHNKTDNVTNTESCEKWSNSYFVQTEIIGKALSKREGILVENLVRLYNIGIVIIISHMRQVAFLNYIYFAHPDIAIVIHQSNTEFRKDRLSECIISFSGQGEIASHLAHVREEYPGPAIIWNMLADDVTQLLVSEGHEGDILVLPDSEATKTSLGKQCVTHASWRVHSSENKLFIKSVNTEKHPLVSLPPSPNLISDLVYRNAVMVDIILFTKNRPLQTLAFMKSLAHQVTGINKIYVQYVADDQEFEEGYNLVAACVSELDIVLVPEKGKGFRTTFVGLLEASEASHVVLAVDELIWIRPVDLHVAASVLHQNRDTTAAFQLRLGEDVGVYNQIQNKHHVIKDVYPELDILAYYPLRLPYDFGYLMHVDALLMPKADMLTDFSHTMTQFSQPSTLENMWMRCCMQPRARKWHLMYRTSRAFNNILSEDQRVMHTTSPGQSSYDLARRLLVDRTEIDVHELTKSVVGRPVSTHMRKSVAYTALTCR